MHVCGRHGINMKFSCRGIKIAIDFFHAAGHKVVSFLPVIIAYIETVTVTYTRTHT